MEKHGRGRLACGDRVQKVQFEAEQIVMTERGGDYEVEIGHK